MLFVCLLSVPVRGRSEKYISYIRDRAQTAKFFKKVDRIYQEQIPEEETTLFTFHPHSVFCYGFLVNLNLYDDAKDKLSNMVGLGSRFILNSPLYGFHFKFWGVEPINQGHLKTLMEGRKTLGMIPGGYEEATITTPKQLRVFIETRKGFIKYGLKYGYTIRPILILKEHQFYNTFDYFRKFRLFLNKLKMPAVIFWSKFGPYLPSDPQIITVIGRGVRGQNPYEGVYQPSKEEIESAHEKYKAEILRMYAKHRHLNGDVPIKLF